MTDWVKREHKSWRKGGDRNTHRCIAIVIITAIETCETHEEGLHTEAPLSMPTPLSVPELQAMKVHINRKSTVLQNGAQETICCSTSTKLRSCGFSIDRVNSFRFVGINITENHVMDITHFHPDKENIETTALFQET